MTKSNAVTYIIKRYIEGKWRFIPGNGKSLGNYVYVDDVVEGHLLAMEKGRATIKRCVNSRGGEYPSGLT